MHHNLKKINFYIKINRIQIENKCRIEIQIGKTVRKITKCLVKEDTFI